MPDERASITREEFGQRQPLTVAIHHLIRDYPLSVGLFKEFIQNADDAGASEIRFILDRRTHPVTELHHPHLARLSGPSLLVWNDAKFTEEDLRNIQHLGDSQKISAPAKIGRFGLGVNCCYNVTDYPLLLARESLRLFDPHRTAEHFSDQSATGTSWPLTEALWNSSRDLLSPFAVVGLTPRSLAFDATAFRLPLRNDEHITINGKIRSESCSPDQIRSLIDDFRTIAPSILIFLKNVLTVSFQEITTGSRSPTLLLSTETLNAEEVTAQRQKLAEVLQGDAETSFTTIDQRLEKDLRTIYNHRVRLEWEGSDTTYDWLISTGFFKGQDNRLLSLARAMNKRGEKALPVAGVATNLLASNAPTKTATPGEVFCFLPLPDARGGATLPVQINGFFDINSSRRGLTHEAGVAGTVEELRGKWNRALIEEGVAEAYACLLANIVETNPALYPDCFYQLWLDPSGTLPPPLGHLVEAFYKACIGKPLLRSSIGCWVKPDELRLVDISIREPLLAEGLATVADPEIPSHIVAGFKKVKNPLKKTTPAEVRDLYRVETDPNCDLAAAPRKSLANREWLGALAQFSFKDHKEHEHTGPNVPRAFTGLPFLLTADGKLHAFVTYPKPVLTRRVV
jgi:sacsin